MTVFTWIIKKCHWPVNDKFSWDHGGTCTFTKCHWPVNDSFHRVDTMWGGAPLQNVIDRSMTILIEVIQKLSLTGQWQFSEGSTPCGEVHLYKLSLTGQWQFWSSFLRMSLTGQLQFLLPLGMGYHRKLSLIGQWQFWGVDTVAQGAPLQNCHWPVNDNFETAF